MTPVFLVLFQSDPSLALTFVEEKTSSDITTISAHGDQIGETSERDWLGMNQSEVDMQPDEYSSADGGTDGLSYKLSQWMSQTAEFKGQHIVLAAIPALPVRHPWAKSQRYLSLLYMREISSAK